MKLASNANASGGTTTAACVAPNPIAVGGGVSTANGTVTTSAPAVGTSIATDGATPNGWQGVANKPFTVYVVCAK
ncbi:MAG: hypothetical protein LC708_02055 [Actinobacteria bacterium]|nr:hypothetical protein [Actinomycetota bacterium]